MKKKKTKQKKSKANPSGIVSSVCFVFDKQDFPLVFNVELRAVFFFKTNHGAEAFLGLSVLSRLDDYFKTA